MNLISINVLHILSIIIFNERSAKVFVELNKKELFFSLP